MIQIGNPTGSNATLIVTGDGTVVSTGRIGVGALSNAAGTLIVENNGLVRVTGVFNSAFNPANTGTITVQTGGRVEVAGSAFIGRGGTAHATVDGDGASFDAGGNINIGYEAGSNGVLTILDGASVTARASALGFGGNGTATVTGQGSTLSIQGELRVGGGLDPAQTGTGVLTIANQGIVSTGFVAFGQGNGTVNIDGDGTLETGRIFQHPDAVGATHAVNLDGGTLRLKTDVADLFANMSAGSVVLGPGGGIFDTEDHDVSVVSDISGTGDLTKRGTGTLRFMTAMGYTGATVVEQGTLAAGAAGVFAPASAHFVMSQGTLFAGDFDQSLPFLQNQGTVSLAGGTAGNTLTVTGNYVGAGGTVVLDTVLGDDASPTDLFIVQGDSSGSSRLRIINVGGGGSQTVDGIKVVDVAGASTGAFSLDGDYVHRGEQAVVGGAYAYKLYQGGTVTPNDGDWYLRSELMTQDTTGPLYQIGVPAYEAYPRILLALNKLPTLQQRVGNRLWAGAHGATGLREDAGTSAEAEAERVNPVWGRIVGSYSRTKPGSSTSDADYDQNILELHAGLDGVIVENVDGKLIAGLVVHHGRAKASIRSIYGNSTVSADGFGLGGTLTWHGADGLYADAQARTTWYAGDLKARPSGIDLVDDNDGFGYAGSLEVGQRIALEAGWALIPQAQLIYSNVDFDSFADAFGASVGLDRGESLIGRLGVGLSYENFWYGETGKVHRAKIYSVADIYHEFLDGTSVDVSGTRFSANHDKIRGGVSVGGSYAWDDGKYSVYGEGMAVSGLESSESNYTLEGQLGFRVNW